MSEATTDKPGSTTFLEAARRHPRPIQRALRTIGMHMGTPEATALVLVVLVAVVIWLVVAERRLRKEDAERRDTHRKDERRQWHDQHGR